MTYTAKDVNGHSLTNNAIHSITTDLGFESLGPYFVFYFFFDFLLAIFEKYILLIYNNIIIYIILKYISKAFVHLF